MKVVMLCGYYMSCIVIAVSVSVYTHVSNILSLCTSAIMACAVQEGPLNNLVPSMMTLPRPRTALSDKRLYMTALGSGVPLQETDAAPYGDRDRDAMGGGGGGGGGPPVLPGRAWGEHPDSRGYSGPDPAGGGGGGGPGGGERRRAGPDSRFDSRYENSYHPSE
jgi:hypothetical protein